MTMQGDTAGFPEALGDEDAVLAILAAIERRDRAMRADELPQVAACLAHPIKTIRRAAAGALAASLAGGIVGPADCEALLAQDDADVRWGTAFALGRAGHANARVLDIAIEALANDDGDVRWAAASIVVATARACGELRARLRTLVASGTSRTRKMALLCLCDCGERDGVLYRAALADADPFVRLAALTSLARGGDRSPESLAAIASVADSDEDARVRRGAGAILRRLTAA